MQWIDFTAETSQYLAFRAKMSKIFAVPEPMTGLYVQWLRNESDFCVRDYQRKPKTELLPLGYAVKCGRFRRGFFQRRGLDDSQLHVAGSVTTSRARWRRDSKGNWRVYRDVFREIAMAEGPTDGERDLRIAVESFLAAKNLLILKSERLDLVEANNANAALEKISIADFLPRTRRDEWMHVHRFDEGLFSELVSKLDL